MVSGIVRGLACASQSSNLLSCLELDYWCGEEQNLWYHSMNKSTTIPYSRVISLTTTIVVLSEILNIMRIPSVIDAS